MLRQFRHEELRSKSQQLLQGALRHVRATALAAALVPLGTVDVSPAVAQDCGSGGACASASVPSPCDFATSGGFVVADSMSMANFGAHGGCKKGAFWGHLNYVDHHDDYHVNSIQITGYLTPFPGSNIRDICGVAETNTDESPVLFRIRLIDNGEPGTSDEFGIRLSNGYHVAPRSLGAGWPGGGDVELHGSNPSTVGPDPAPGELTMCGGVDAP